MGIFRDLAWFFKLEKNSYLIGIIALITVAILNLFPPLIIGRVVDQIEQGTLMATELLTWCLVLLGIGLAMFGLRFVWRLGIFGPSVRLSRLLRNRLYHHFTLQSSDFFQKHRTGDLMAHATNDIRAVQITAGQGILTFVDSFITGGLVIFSMIFFISWKLTFIALLPMPFMVRTTRYYGKLMHKRFAQAQEAFSRLNEKVQENVSGMRVIKAFGQGEAEEKVFADISDQVVDKNMAVARVEALFSPTIQLVNGSSFLLTIIFGAIFVLRGEITIGQLTQFSMYLGQLTWPMLAFGVLFNIVERGRASYDRIKKLLAVDPTIKDKENALKKMPTGDLKFNIDSFTYPGKEEPTLEQINFTLPQGQTLGIVGKTGSGKTTLLRLLLREFDLDKGDITIGGVSIYDFALDNLRSSIGYVTQDQFLFSTTIRENIAFGKPEATEEEIRKVASLAAIHEDILEFKDGYETLVGERGITLSGGQKQRIAIARALLLDPEILVLDDSLSAVDAKTEQVILNALRKNRSGKTTLISAHRLSAVEHADLILVLQEGKVIEKGTHSQLLQIGGWYAQMYRQQQLESLVEQGGGHSGY